MKASDLRIGNLVNRNDGEGFLPINVEIATLERLLVSDHEFEGILLTEEWLLKFGFVYCESKFWDKPNIMTIQISNNESLDYEDNEFFIAGVSSHRVVTLWKSPIYVHQLQNLYFALTGEELTIKTSEA